MCGISKCQYLTSQNVLIVLLEYIDLFQSEWQHETTFVRVYPAFYHSTLVYLTLSIASAVIIN